ncbi:DUF2155 domain-containing protein [Roseivivax sp. CAU 1753]
MRRFAVALICAMLPAVAAAQETQLGTGAFMRVLDKLNGITTDAAITNGALASAGRIEVQMRECRYPSGNPSGDAYAFVTIREIGVAAPVFRGWMIASAPALNPMDHPRYDVWVLRCITS